MAAPLQDSFVVVDLSEGIAGGYCTKILADAGADIIKVETPDGDRLRMRSASGTDVDCDTGGPLFHYLSASKHSVVADIGDDVDLKLVQSLIRGADAVVWRRGSRLCSHAELAPTALRELNPSALVLAMTPFGLDSPWRDRPATQFTLQAMSGGPFMRGHPHLPPISVGGDHGDFNEGGIAALGLLLGRYRALHTGRGDLIDAAALDGMQLTHAMFPVSFTDLTGIPWRLKRTEGTPAIHPTKDGYVGFWVTSGQQWLDFCAMVGRQDWLDDQDLLLMGNRALRHEELVDAIDEWTLPRTTTEIEELASAFRLPVAPIGTGESLTGIDHYRERGFYVRNDHTGLTQPDVWYEFSAETGRKPFGPSPRLGEHTAYYRLNPPSPLMPQPAEPRQDQMALPFEGLRIADMTAYWAGPIITHFFALFGADVIHLESTNRPDGIRSAATIPLSEDYWWETSPFFTATNTNKRGLAVDLQTDKGREVALRLMRECDVFVENFSPRVVGQLGIDWEDLRHDCPDLIMARAPAFGIDGPWRDRVGYAPTVDQASGISWVTGVPDERPMNAGAPSDALGGLHGSIAIMLALEHRRRTGDGTLVEVPQVRSALNVTAEQVLEYDTNGVLLERVGNRSWVVAPQGAYRVRDVGRELMPDDDWVALTVETDDQWRALCDVMGDEALAADDGLASVPGRLAEQDRIDAAISAWCRDLDADELVAELVAAGIPAAPMVVAHEVADIEAVEFRHLYEVVDQPHAGRLRIIGFPVRVENGPPTWHRTPAPKLGQHNREILEDLLGYDSDVVDAFELDGVIGTKALLNLGW